MIRYWKKRPDFSQEWKKEGWKWKKNIGVNVKNHKKVHFHAFQLLYFISSWMNVLFAVWNNAKRKQTVKQKAVRRIYFGFIMHCTQILAHKKKNKNNIIFIILAFNRTNGLIALCYVLLRRVLFTALGCLIQFEWWNRAPNSLL